MHGRHKISRLYETLVGGSHGTKEHGVIRHEQDVFQDGRFSSTCSRKICSCSILLVSLTSVRNAEYFCNVVKSLCN